MDRYAEEMEAAKKYTAQKRMGSDVYDCRKLGVRANPSGIVEEPRVVEVSKDLNKVFILQLHMHLA